MPRCSGLWPPLADQSGELTGLILAKGDDVWMIVVDEPWEGTRLAMAHADLAVEPLTCFHVLPQRHETPVGGAELWGRAQCHALTPNPHNLNPQNPGVIATQIPHSQSARDSGSLGVPLWPPKQQEL